MEAVAAAPAAAHRAIAGMAAAGVLQRHYTLNIDGLDEAVGMDTWHPDTNPEGQSRSTYLINEMVCGGRTAAALHPKHRWTERGGGHGRLALRHQP